VGSGGNARFSPIRPRPLLKTSLDLHAETAAHGLLWVSRQADEAKALVLFGDRIAESAFKPEIDREPLYEGEHLDALLSLAEHVGITQVIGL
jgi:hypothetical protein